MAKAKYMETSNSSPSKMGRGTVREANGGGEIHRSRPFPSTSLRLVPPSPRFAQRSEEHTSELQSLMRNSYAVFRLKKTNTQVTTQTDHISDHPQPNKKIHRLQSTH